MRKKFRFYPKKTKKQIEEKRVYDIINRYLDPSFPGSFSGVLKFTKGLNSRSKFLYKPKQVSNILQKEWTYTRHRPISHNFATRQVIVPHIDHTWQIDLVDMQKLAKLNDSFRYLLTCIDVFSKFAWVVPLKFKRGQDVVSAFESIFKNGRLPKHIQADKGTEFFNSQFKSFLKNFNINLYSTLSQKKASVVERFNRTLRDRMERYFSSNDKELRYIDILPLLVDSYNNTYHSSIKLEPIKVNKSNESKTFFTLYKFNPEVGDDRSISIKLAVGDLVRLSKVKRFFEKGYTPNWTSEIFKIRSVLPSVPPVYSVEDLDSNIIEGKFYEKELQKVLPSDLP